MKAVDSKTGERSAPRLRIAMLGMRGIPANYGGFETCVEEVAPRLAAMGHEVTVYCRVPTIQHPDDTYRGVHLAKLPTIRNKYFDTLFHTTISAVHARLSGFDVAIVFGVGNSPQALALKWSGLPVLLNVDGLDWKRDKWPGVAKLMLRFAEWLAGGAATRTITDSHNVQNHYREHHGVDLDYIPYGASPAPPALNGQLRSLNLQPGGYYLYVGRFVPENRVLDLVEAARRADITRPVVVVGDAPYSSDYISKLVERGEGHVTFPGAIYGDDYWELNHHAHAYVFPVASDGTHPALIEAMACGNPVLVRGIPDNRAVGGDTVRYFETVDELVELLEWVDQGGDEPRQLGQAAQARAAKEFNWDRVSNDYLDLALKATGRDQTPVQQSDRPSTARAVTDWLEQIVFGPGGQHAAPQDVDAATIIEQIAIHGVGPLLGARVESGELSVSSGVDTFLREQTDLNRQRQHLLRSDLDRTLAAFKRAGIEAIPLKGSAMLLQQSEEEIAWRPMADIDLLVRHSEQLQVDLAYAHAGYCLSSISWKHRVYGPCDPEEPSDYPPGEHPDHPREIESHPAIREVFRGFEWDLTPWIVNNLDSQNDVLVPDARAMTLHLAVHASIAALESTSRIAHIVDLSRQLARTGPDAILQAVEKSGAEQYARFVYPALALVARWSDDAQVVAAVERLQPAVPRGMVNWIETASFDEISWGYNEARPLMDRLGIWARTPVEQSRMVMATALPTPAQLAGSGYEGDWPFAVPRWYRQYYLDLGKRVVRR